MFPVIYFTPSAAIYAQLKWRLMLFKQTRFLPKIENADFAPR